MGTACPDVPAVGGRWRRRGKCCPAAGRARWAGCGWHPPKTRAAVSGWKDGEEQGPSCETNCRMDSGRETKQAGKSLNTSKHKPKVVKAGGN